MRTVLSHFLQCDVLFVAVAECIDHGVGKDEQLLGGFLPVLRACFVERLPDAFITGFPDFSGRGERVRVVEDGAD